ncbi:MAG TPA: methyltransferase domain-containing protein [Alphaproteobacteria bacterium]
MTPDPNKLQALVGRILGDVGATATAALVVLGDRLGLYKALAEGGAVTPAELAARTDVAERYLREWLSAQAAAGYIEYDAAEGRFSMTAEQATAFADEGGPAFMPGAFQLFASMFIDEAKIAEAFRTGKGVGWHEHHPCLFRGTERFFRPGYASYLVDAWIPALDGVKQKLERGAAVADVGCGHGASTILMAKAFPKSRFAGFDYHWPSVERAREAAREARVEDRVFFEVAAAKTYPGGSYDLVTFFDCLHDFGDPVGAAAHVRSTLSPEGSWMIVEPFANDELVDNLNLVGRIYYAASTMICTPASLSQEVGLGLGAQAGERRLREVVTAAGFARFRRASETPFNLVFEARP